MKMFECLWWVGGLEFSGVCREVQTSEAQNCFLQRRGWWKMVAEMWSGQPGWEVRPWSMCASFDRCWPWGACVSDLRMNKEIDEAGGNHSTIGPWERKWWPGQQSYHPWDSATVLVALITTSWKENLLQTNRGPSRRALSQLYCLGKRSPAWPWQLLAITDSTVWNRYWNTQFIAVILTVQILFPLDWSGKQVRWNICVTRGKLLQTPLQEAVWGIVYVVFLWHGDGHTTGPREAEYSRML